MLKFVGAISSKVIRSFGSDRRDGIPFDSIVLLQSPPTCALVILDILPLVTGPHYHSTVQCPTTHFTICSWPPFPLLGWLNKLTTIADIQYNIPIIDEDFLDTEVYTFCVSSAKPNNLYARGKQSPYRQCGNRLPWPPGTFYFVCSLPPTPINNRGKRSWWHSTPRYNPRVAANLPLYLSIGWGIPASLYPLIAITTAAMDRAYVLVETMVIFFTRWQIRNQLFSGPGREWKL